MYVTQFCFVAACRFVTCYYSVAELWLGEAETFIFYIIYCLNSELFKSVDGSTVCKLKIIENDAGTTFNVLWCTTHCVLDSSEKFYVHGVENNTSQFQ